MEQIEEALPVCDNIITLEGEQYQVALASEKEIQQLSDSGYIRLDGLAAGVSIGEETIYGFFFNAKHCTQTVYFPVDRRKGVTMFDQNWSGPTNFNVLLRLEPLDRNGVPSDVLCRQYKDGEDVYAGTFVREGQEFNLPFMLENPSRYDPAVMQIADSSGQYSIHWVHFGGKLYMQAPYIFINVATLYETFPEYFQEHING